MDFKWTEECSEMVKLHRSKSNSVKQTLNVHEFVTLLNAHL